MEVSNDRYNLKAQHSVDEYKQAFLACRGLMRGTKCLEMLKANYSAPKHTITAAQMAEAVGYANWNAANLRYGKFAGAVAEELGHVPGALEGVGEKVTPDVAVLVSFGGGRPVGADVTWQLLPAVVRALEEMKWVRSERGVTGSR